MCGIAGIINFTKQPVEMDQLSAMTNQMIERGPDDDGFFISDHIGLAFRRLSIIDVSGGHQPLTNEDENLHLVLNGEIYNYIEIRNQLIDRGHRFKTMSDSEVFLHLYEEKGVKALDELNGMFALALWDSNQNTLLIARDRLGIKPLFYSNTESQFMFGSDTRALRALHKQEIDTDAVLKYIALSYVPGEETVWKGIKKLPPAHYLIIDRHCSIQKHCYWSLEKSGQWKGTEDEAASQLKVLLSDAIRMQMRSDVPVGIFLSGGVDSSAIVAIASQFTSNPLRTFTINFEGKESLDAKFANEVAVKYNTHHTQIEMSAQDAIQALDDLITKLDEPLADSALLPAYLLSKAARDQGIIVLLNGAGGDEIFGGYLRHWPPRFGSPTWVAESIPCLFRGIVTTVWSLVQPHRAVRASNPVFAWNAGVSGINMHACRKLLGNPNDYEKIEQTILDEFSPLQKGFKKGVYSHVRMIMDLQTYLPNDVLSLTDKATMAASVEGRVPLLDHRLVEYAFSLPPNINLLNNDQKGLFKKVLKNILPPELIKRKKEGFNAPVHEWLQQGGGLNIHDELLNHRTEVLNDILDTSALKSILSSHKKSNLASETLFSLYLFNRWLRKQNI